MGVEGGQGGPLSYPFPPLVSRLGHAALALATLGQPLYAHPVCVCAFMGAYMAERD